MTGDSAMDPATAPALGLIEDAPQRARLVQYLDGELSGEMALMYCLQIRPDVDLLRHQLDAARTTCIRHGGPGRTSDALQALSSLIESNYAGCVRIASMLSSGIDSDEPARSVEEGVAFCRNLFDWSVGQSPAASVALYSLGNAEILDAGTAEIIHLLHEWRVVHGDADFLEIGCGTGRFQQALSPHVKSVTGIDVSSRMIAAARARCAGLSNVALRECSGHDLASCADDSFDVILAVDSMPYLYQSGMPLVERHFSEARRVLRDGSSFVILEFSYRGNIDLDRADVEQLATVHSFDVRVAGTKPFTLWDGAAFHLVSSKR